METIVKFLMALTLATAAAAIIKVDPKEFTCTAESPVNEPRFSDTNPPVALTHIFCGDIVRKPNSVKAQGFHSTALVNTDGNACARPTGNIWCATVGYDMDECNSCFFYSEGIEVYDSLNDRYVEKTTDVGQKNKFFPKTWDATKVVNTALYVFKESNMNGDMKPGNANACLANAASDDCGHYSSVMIYTDGDNIISAFPVDKC